jgi:hypothetical protein
MEPQTYLVEVITDTSYTAGEPCTLTDAEMVAQQLRRDMAGSAGFVGVRIINLVFATQW